MFSLHTMRTNQEETSDTHITGMNVKTFSWVKETRPTRELTVYKKLKNRKIQTLMILWSWELEEWLPVGREDGIWGSGRWGSGAARLCICVLARKVQEGIF